MSGNWKGDLHVAKCEDEILTAVMMYGLPGTRFWEISLRKKAKLILKPSEADIAKESPPKKKWRNPMGVVLFTRAPWQC